MSVSTPATTAPTVGPDAKASLRVPVERRWPIVTVILTLGALGLTLVSRGDARFSLHEATPLFEMGEFSLPAQVVGGLMTLIAAVCTALVIRQALARQRVQGWLIALAGFAFIVAFLTWTVAGRPDASMPLVRLLGGTLIFAVPLVFGALSGVVCERSGIINLAIEAQMLVGAFGAVVAASLARSAWVGLISAPLAGVLIAALLALFTIKYRVDHIITGVVLNMLAIGLTGFLFQSVLIGNEEALNAPMMLPNLPIPVLSLIPVIGPVLFNQNILVYLMYVIVVFLGIMLFRSQWGLRTRAVGEHPKAADTVGIKVNRTRWINVLWGGAIAGLGGAMFTIGQGLPFAKNMVAGNGYIALAAMILGRWHPKGVVAAAVLFGFATNLGYIMQTVNAPLPVQFVNMIPYIATVLAVAGFVGAVRAPAAEGKPYP